MKKMITIFLVHVEIFIISLINTIIVNDIEPLLYRNANKVEYIVLDDEYNFDNIRDTQIIEPIESTILYPDNTEPDIKELSQDEDIRQIEYSDDDIYILSKMVMCEAEGESYICKKLIAQTIINRVKSSEFPNTVSSVIFEKNQFTPIYDGKWEYVEPNQECIDAVMDTINNDPLIDSLWFESVKSGSTWHSRNLEKILELDNTRFYKSKDNI